MTGIRKADPRARRQALWLIAIAAVAAAGLIYWTQSGFRQLEVLAGTDPGLAMARVLLMLRILAALLVASMLGLAIYLYRLGTRISATGECPPPGARVLRDTPVVSGSGALARARFLKVVAMVLALLSIAAGGMLLLLAGLLAQGV